MRAAIDSKRSGGTRTATASCTSASKKERFGCRRFIALGFVKELNKIDHTVSAMPEHVRTGERKRLAVPMLDAFKTWLDAQALVVLPKAPIAEAIGYVRNQQRCR